MAPAPKAARERIIASPPRNDRFVGVRGWRVEVNLVKRSWRYVKGRGSRRKVGKYRPLATLPGGESRLGLARARSQKAAEKRGKAGINKNV